MRAAVTDENENDSQVVLAARRPRRRGCSWANTGCAASRMSRRSAFDGDGTLLVASNLGRDTLALYHYDTDAKTLGRTSSPRTRRRT